MLRAKITGVGSSLPEKVLTNADLEKIVETSDEWITTRTGIKERRILSEGEHLSDYCVKAAKEALEKSGTAPDELDLIINGTFTPDFFLPSNACVIQNKLGVTRDVPAFDLAAACSGFVYGLETANHFIRSGQYKKILVIGGDALSAFTNWADRGSCVLFGDGAGAAVVEGSHDSTEGILSADLGAAGRHLNILKVEGGGSVMPGPALLDDPSLKNKYYIEMAGNELFKIVTRLVVDSVKRAIDKAGLTIQDIDYFVPHQANIRIIDYVAEKLGMPKEKVAVTIHKYGNNSAASVPVTLYDSLCEGKIKKGDNVVMTAFGAGLTYASMVVRWAY
ncbi:MAG: 3-oxoacyl-ACP synthase [Elusimicrobia bacterium RIFOXYB2_FULL_49_7]|nr:MAG: 3-oxoacyl-ACP synthase [Elusimicrobia bacterium RIFOXYB2_FULL_49_7]